ncbi:MAG: Gfo/Idh/MocA family oxidoreductase [Planctomycetota bacterium]
MADIKRYVLVGTGGRGLSMFGTPLLRDFPETAALVGLFDNNASRLRAANNYLKTDLPVFTDFDRMLRELDPDGVVVATSDDTHADYIVRALRAGKRAYSEKPLCISAAQCRAIREAEAGSRGRVFVTHNMRYGPAETLLRTLIAEGRIGRLLSMEFRENLDRSHGADYFRRWHRFKARSGGLLIHKASHHFDFLNWVSGSRPDRLVATGATMLYGRNGSFRHTRCGGCPHAARCGFYVDLSKDENARRLYLEAERDDGYFRDGCVFDERVDIEDQASVIYTYENGIRVTYSLTAFASYEGIWMSFEGTEGRLEYNSISETRWAVGNRIVPGMDKLRGQQLMFYHPKRGPEVLAIPAAEGSHGGSDPQLRRDFFGRPWEAERSDRMATLDEAIQAVLVGHAANMSIADGGRPVSVQSFLDG